MAVEVIICIEDRKVILDIEPNDINGLKEEFDEWCNDDEAMTERRKANAPVFSMFNQILDSKVEVKRKYSFREGDTVYVTWSPLKFQQDLKGNPDAMHQTSDTGVTERDARHDEANKDTLNRSTDGDSDGSLKLLSTSLQRHKFKSPNQLESSDEDGIYSDGFEESDHEDYGEVTEYYTCNQWSSLPKYLKLREKSRFELHEAKMKCVENKIPFQPEQTTFKIKMDSSSQVKRKQPNKKHHPAKRRGNKENIPPPGSPNGSDSSDFSKKISSADRSKTGSSSKCGGSGINQKTNKETNPTPGSSTSGGCFFDRDDLKKMKPELPYYNILEILEEHYEDCETKLKEHIDALKEHGIVYKASRCSIIRLLTRHLYFRVASKPQEVTIDMREGLAKSIVMDYPKFQVTADGKTTYPWNALFERGAGRGWIANSARSIQKKHRVRKSDSKKKSLATVLDSHKADPKSIEKIQQLALLMPGRSEKSEIIKGMKDTFETRQVARRKQTSVAEIMNQFPHLASYDGEILQEEFKMLHPKADDFCRNFQMNLVGILALPARTPLDLPVQDDNLKALILISKNLPRDIRSKGDPKPKNPIPQLTDIIEVVKLGQDIDMFAVDKVSKANGPIQPYLILVKSPLQGRIVKFFLVLDSKPMQIASSSLVKAFDLLIKAYFVFNVKYPLGWRSTFHCLARCFANVIETGGGKSRPDRKTPSEQELMAKISV